jgi:amino acid permease
VHLRMPSIDRGVQAFVWALVFFLFLWFGSLALDFAAGTSFVISLLVAAAIFLFVRTRGDDAPERR